MLVTCGTAVLATGRAGQGMGAGLAPSPWGSWTLPGSPPLGWGFLILGAFLCALKTIFALSGVRKKYSDMVEKDIYIPWWAVRGWVSQGVFQCPPQPSF